MLTINNPDLGFAEILQLLNPTFMTGQLEKGESGTPHWQLFVYWKLQKAFNSIKKALPGAHIEVAKSIRAAIDYCRKKETRLSDEEPFSFGNEPVGASGAQQKEDWDAWYLAAAQGRFEDIPAMIKIKHFGNLLKIAKEQVSGEDSDGVRGIWIHGAPGLGKSHFARITMGSDGYYPKPLNKWWDGYKDESVVVFDDLDSTTMIWCSNFLKIWADKWKFQAETKGSTIMPSYRWFVVTSNFSIDEMLASTPEITKQAIKRRFDEWVMISRTTLKRASDELTWPAEDVAKMYLAKVGLGNPV